MINIRSSSYHSSLSNRSQWIPRVLANLLNHLDEFWHHLMRVVMVGVRETQYANCFLIVKVFPNVNWVLGAIDDKLQPLPLGQFEIGICLLVSQLDILECSDRHSHFQRIVSLFIFFASIFSLVGVRVALPSSLDLVLTPSLIIVDQKYLLDLWLLHLHLFRDNC